MIVLELLAFIILVNWIAALHVRYQSLKDDKMKFVAIVLAVALSVILFFLTV